MSDVILKIKNHHTRASGAAPRWVRKAQWYFQNRHGEQWFARSDAGRFRLTGGDVGWKTWDVSDPDYEAMLAGLQLAPPKTLAATEELMAVVIANPQTYCRWVIGPDERLFIMAALTASKGLS